MHSVCTVIAPIFIFLDVLIKMNVITKTLQLADGRTITIETGKVAKQVQPDVSPADLPSAKAKPATTKS